MIKIDTFFKLVPTLLRGNPSEFTAIVHPETLTNAATIYVQHLHRNEPAVPSPESRKAKLLNQPISSFVSNSKMLLTLTEAERHNAGSNS